MTAAIAPLKIAIKAHQGIALAVLLIEPFAQPL